MRDRQIEGEDREREIEGEREREREGERARESETKRERVRRNISFARFNQVRVSVGEPQR